MKLPQGFSPEERSEKAQALFKQGFNCTQSVILAFADVLGLLEDFPQQSPVAGKYPVLGGMWDAGRIVQETGVKTVVITAPGLATGDFCGKSSKSPSTSYR